MTRFTRNFEVQHKIGQRRHRRLSVGRDSDNRRADFLENAQQLIQFTRLATLPDREHDVIAVDDTNIPM